MSGLPTTLRGGGVAVADRRDEIRAGDEALNPVDEIAVERPQGSDVEKANGLTVAGGENLQGGK